MPFNTSLSCQLQFAGKPLFLCFLFIFYRAGLGFPMWSTFLAVMCIMINIGNEVRLCTRWSILKAAMANYRDNPAVRRPVVMITPVYKSAFLAPLIHQLREKEAASVSATAQTHAHTHANSHTHAATEDGLRARVIAVDTWRVSWKEWAEENAFREHVYQFAEFRQQERNPHVFRLPVSDNEVDHVFAPFASYLPFCQDPGDNEEEQYQKLIIIIKVPLVSFQLYLLCFICLPLHFTCVQEFYRVLRPGGTISSYNLIWKSSMFLRAVKEAGGWERIVTTKKWYWPTAFPCHLTTMVKSTSNSGSCLCLLFMFCYGLF